MDEDDTIQMSKARRDRTTIYTVAIVYFVRGEFLSTFGDRGPRNVFHFLSFVSQAFQVPNCRAAQEELSVQGFSQLITNRIGSLIRLIYTLLYVMAIHTYIHTFY